MASKANESSDDIQGLPASQSESLQGYLVLISIQQVSKQALAKAVNLHSM